jgi:superfamily I DNA/RNA helicase
MIRKVLGPPGTGKTTTLLNYVKNYLDQGIAPSRIGYFAFTKKAASHAKEEMIKKISRYEKIRSKIFSNITFICISYTRSIRR